MLEVKKYGILLEVTKIVPYQRKLLSGKLLLVLSTKVLFCGIARAGFV